MSTARWSPSERPAWLRAANAAGRALEAAGLWRVALDACSLLEQARRRTGLDDFGDPGFREPLEILTRAFDEEAAFTPVGRLLARWELRNHLVNRLRVLDLLDRHPEIRDERIESPLFVTGSGRSGTSILHEVLAQDPRHRGLLHWEVLFPCPPPEPATHASDPRIRRADREVRRWERIAPAYRTMHEGGGAVPQEDDYLFDFALCSDHLAGLYPVPSYARWLAGADRRVAFEMHRDVLKILQWRMPKRRWVLKSPTHLVNLETLFAVYPDARVVQTHRDPLKVVGSMASLRTTLHWMRSDHVDPLAMARSSAKGIGFMLDRATAVRDAGGVPADQCVDIRFHDFMSDPIATLASLYDRLGVDLPVRTAARMRDYLAAKPRDRGHGRHQYSLDDLGLDRDALRERYRAYRERYDVPSES